jgi:hypothetical protein
MNTSVVTIDQLTRRASMIEQRQEHGVPPIAFCHFEKSCLRKPEQQLYPDDSFLECMHLFQVIHPQSTSPKVLIFVSDIQILIDTRAPRNRAR